jgi:hypothetical protein
VEAIAGRPFWFEMGCQQNLLPCAPRVPTSQGATVALGPALTLFLSIHVGPPNYWKNLRMLVEQLSAIVAGFSFRLGRRPECRAAPR